jgi:hypothetical protein
MRCFIASFSADNQTWPDMVIEFYQPSFAMACDYAGRLLQSEANTMFYQVEVWEPEDDGSPKEDTVKRLELVMTRSASEVQS